jgi:hypothetical protein
MRTRAVRSLLAAFAAIVAILSINAGVSQASTVRPHWDQSVCPANAWAPGDIYCYQASDPQSWVRFHVYNPGSGHDRAWANGYVGQANLWGNICVVDAKSPFPESCIGEPGNTHNGVITGNIQDGPTDYDFGELDLYDSSTGNLVAVYQTQGF